MLKTDYVVDSVPFSEYPRPQMRRDSFLNLNGTWRFETHEVKTQNLLQSGEIRVPFSPESALSLVEQPFKLTADQLLIYEREFCLDAEMLKGVTYIHFGAVDQSCTVFINGCEVGSHNGGFTPFSFDVTDVVVLGENTIKVICRDLTELSEGARGKQHPNPKDYWYTAQSGIWQTVWMESAPKEHIKSLHITPDFKRGQINIVSDCKGQQKIEVFDGEKSIITETFEREITLTYDFEAWSPESPKLYDFKITAESGDEINSYFGLRSFGIGKDKKGKARLLLNEKPYFFNGLLDQGYWPDGLLTPPSDKAMLDELKTVKAMGFNTLRKHIKIEPMRWYYYCDVLGIAVWQDFVNGGGLYNFMHVGPLPVLGFKHRDDDYKYFSRTSKSGREEFVQSVHETVNSLYNAVSIAVWVPFNEGWGQFDSAKITKLVKQLDSSRIVDSVSGWHDQGLGKTELKSIHNYYFPLTVPKDKRPVVLSEYGGYSYPVKDHMFNEKKIFGYRIYKTKDELKKALRKLFIKRLKPLIKKGLCGAIYTQVSDVEEEINGIITYDRKVIKVPVEFLLELNTEITQEASRVE